MNAQPIPKYIIRIALVMSGLSVLLCCIGLPLATFVPRFEHLTFWNGYKFSDIVAGAVGSLSVGTIYVVYWPTYAPAWKSMQLRWKLAFGIGGILTVCSFVGMQIAVAMLPHPQKSTLSESTSFLIWMALILCGLAVFCTGFTQLMVAFLRLKRKFKREPANHF